MGTFIHPIKRNKSFLSQNVTPGYTCSWNTAKVVVKHQSIKSKCRIFLFYFAQ